MVYYKSVYYNKKETSIHCINRKRKKKKTIKHDYLRVLQKNNQQAIYCEEFIRIGSHGFED